MLSGWVRAFALKVDQVLKCEPFDLGDVRAGLHDFAPAIAGGRSPLGGGMVLGCRHDLLLFSDIRAAVGGGWDGHRVDE